MANTKKRGVLGTTAQTAKKTQEEERQRNREKARQAKWESEKKERDKKALAEKQKASSQIAWQQTAAKAPAAKANVAKPKEKERQQNRESSRQKLWEATQKDAYKYDAQFTPEYFEKDESGLGVWAADSFNKNDTKSRAEQLDVARKVQAGMRYRYEFGDRDEEYNADADSMFAFNDSANSFRQKENLQTMLDGATEDEIREIIADWEKRIADAGEHTKSFYASSTKEDLDYVKEYARNNFSSFVNEDMDKTALELAQTSAQLNRATKKNAYDADILAEASSALEAMNTGMNAVDVVYRNEKLREALDFDTLANDPAYEDETDLQDELRKRVNEMVSGGNADQATYNEDVNALAAKKDELSKQLSAQNEQRNNLLTTEKYQRMLDEAWVKDAAAQFNPEDYQWSDANGYNLPTLPQIMENPEAAFEQYNQARAAGAGSGMAETFGLIEQMPEEARQLYKALYVNEGEESANAFFEHIKPELYERETAMRVEEKEQFAEEHPILASAGSVPEKFLGDLAGVADMIAGREGENQFTQIYQAERDTVAQNLAEKTPWAVVNGTNLVSAFYQGTMSYVDSMFGRGVTGLMGGGAVTGDVLLGLGSAADAYSSAYAASDGDVGKSIIYGIGSGLLTAGSEHISWGALSNPGDLTSPVGILKYIGSSGITEGGEEVVEGLGGKAIEGLILGSDSEIAQTYKYYTANGYTPTEAIGKIGKEVGFETTMEFLIGSVLGSTAAGINASGQGVQQRSTDKSVGQQIIDNGNVTAVIRAGLSSGDPNLEKISRKLMQKLESGEVDNASAETIAEVQLVAEETGMAANGEMRAEQRAAENAAAVQEAQNDAAAQAKEDARAEQRAINQANADAAAEAEPEVSAETPKQQVRENAMAEKNAAAVKESQNEATRKAAAEKEQARAEQREINAQKAKEKAEANKKIAEAFKGNERKLGLLYRKTLKALDVQIEGAQREDAVAAVQARLAQLGETVIEPVAEAIVAIAGDEKVTQAQKDLVEANTIRQGVLNDVTTGLVAAWSSNVASSKTLSLGERRRELQGATTREINLPEAQTAGGEPGQKIKPVSIEQDVEADVQETMEARAAQLGDEAAAETMRSNYDGKQNVRAYTNAFQAAYDYGQNGVDKESARKSMLTTGLTAEQFEAAYTAGANADSTATPVAASASGGKFSFAGDLGSRQSGFDGNQRAAVNALRRIAQTGIVNIEVFESTADASGSYAEYENGSYDRETNTIRIDINAGRNTTTSLASYALLRTASHELTHFIKAQNAEGYRALRNFVATQLTSDGTTTFDGLVARKMEQQPDLSYADAVEEVVADGCEMMLKDSAAIQQLAQENKGLFHRIRRWITNFVRSVKRAFQGVDASSEEARLLKDAEGLQKLWDDALVKAGQNVQAASKPDAPKKAQPAAAVEKQGIPYRHIDARTLESVKEKDTELFCSEVEAARYAYAAAAGILMDDLNRSAEGKKIFIWDKQGGLEVTGQKRSTTEMLAHMKDSMGWTWDDIRKALNGFIDMGDPEKGYPLVKNTARNRRMEVYLHEILTEGYTTIDGTKIAPWREYAEMMAEYQGSEGSGLKAKVPEDAIPFEEYAFADEIADDGVKFSKREKADQNKDIRSIKTQIAENQNRLNAMDPVYVKNINVPKGNKETVELWAKKELASTGYQVERQNFGRIVFDEGRINVSFNYLNTPGEYAAILAVPRVLKRGIEITARESHKYRGFPTVTFAAPVEINGVRGNMAVVVKREKKNVYKTHRILMPDGSAFEYNENAEPTPTRGVVKNDPFALSIGSALDESVSQIPGAVNKKLSVRTDTEQFRNWFDGSKMVNEDGSPKIMYHGTPYGGFTVFKGWQYFTDNQQYADVYQNPSASSIRGRYNEATNPTTYAVYLSVKKPFDTRLPEVRKIWQNEFYGKWGDGTPLSERGLPDWTEGIDLVEFLEENEYDFDAIILDEGGTGGYGDAVKDRGISVVVRSSNQIKSATDNIGTFDPSNPDIRYSIRTNNLSDREILADTFADMAANENERKYIEQYREKIDELNKRQQRLNEVRAELREAMFTPGKRDMVRINQLKREANAIADLVNRADKRLLAFEKAKPLQDVLARERRKVEKKEAEKHQQAVANVRERRNATEIRHKIKAVLDDFNRRLKSPTEKRYIPANMVQLVIAAEELVDTTSGREGTKTREKLAAIQAMYDRYKGDSAFAYVHDEVISDMLKNLADVVGDKSIYQMNNRELTAVYDVLKALKKQVTEAVKLKAGDYAASIIEAGQAMTRETLEAAPLAKGKMGEMLNWQLTPDKFFARLAGYKKNSMWSHVAETFSKGTEKMYEIQRDHYYHFREFTEAKDFDTLQDTKKLVDIGLIDADGNPVLITRGMMLSVYMHLSSEDNARGFMYGGFSVPNLKNYYNGKVAESYGIGSVNSRGTAAELAEIAEAMRDPDLTDEQREALEQRYEAAVARGETQLDNMRRTIEGMLTSYEKRLISAVHAWNDGKSRDYINEVTMDLYGIKKAGVENYYPIHRDTAFVNTDFASISRNVNLENWGSLKDRVASQAPILLTDIAFEMDSALNSMSRYVGYARAQRDFNKLYNVRMPGMVGSVKKAVSTKFGTGARLMGVTGEQYIENYIGDITGSRQAQKSFLTPIRRNLVRSTMTLNLRVGFSQLSAIPKAAAEVGWGNMARGFMGGGMKAIFSKQAREELARENVWFWQRWRGEGGQREFADAKGGGNIVDKGYNWVADSKVGKWFFNWCQNFDVMSTVSMWKMAEAWAEKNTNYARGSQQFKDAVNRKYTEIIRNTQAMSSTTERSDLARTTSEGYSMLTMYRSEAFANFNLLYDAVATLRKYSSDLKNGTNDVTAADVTKAKKHLVGAATSVVIGASLGNAILKLAINALMHAMDGYRDDEDEVTANSIARSIANEVASDTAGMMVFGGELYDILAAKVLGERYYAPNDMALAEVGEALETLMGVMLKEDATKEDWLKASKKLAINTTNMLGVPVENVKRYIKGTEAWFEEIQTGTLGSWEGGVERSNSVNYDRLYNAAMDGDDAKFDQVIKELAENGKDEKEAREGLRGNVRDAYKSGEIDRITATELLVSYVDKDEHEAYWTLKKWDYAGEGNFNKYADLRTALAEADSGAAMEAYRELVEHGVKEETVASELSSLYNSGEAANILNLQIRSDRLYTSTLKLKADGEKHPDDFDDFITAIVNGNGIANEVSKLKSKGYTVKQCMSAINGAFGKSGDRYRVLEKYNPREASILLDRILDAYEALGLDREDEITWINENWTMDDDE